MPSLTAPQITALYEKYKRKDVSFSKEVIDVTGLIPEQIQIKCANDLFPCVLVSTSLERSRIVLNTKPEILRKLNRESSSVSLRFCFKNMESGKPLAFFVSARIAEIKPYNEAGDVSQILLQFTQQAPDDLINVVGRVFDALVNSVKRKDEKVIINADNLRKLKLQKDVVVFIENVPRRCLLLELSFCDVKLAMVGIAKFILDKETALRFDFDDPHESFTANGKFSNALPVEGKQDMIVATVSFNTEFIPLGYKVRLNDYFNTPTIESRKQAK